MHSTVKQQFRILIGICVTLSAVIVTYGLFAYSNLEQKAHEVSNSFILSNQVLEITILSQDYLTDPSNRAADQWESVLKSSKKLADKINAKTPEGRKTSEAIHLFFNQLDSIFDKLRLHHKSKNKHTVDWNNKFDQLQSDIIYKAHYASSIANKYARHIRDEALSFQKMTFTFLISTGLVGFICIIFLISSIKSRIEKSLDWLEDNIKKLSLGDPTVKVHDTQEDEFTEVMAKFQNMTELVEKRYQELITELKDAMSKVDQANQAKTNFLANISHEIRTPLSIIEGYTMLFRDKEYKNKDECIAKIYWNVQFVTNLINDILDLSKVESGKFNIEKKQFNVSEVISPTIELLSEKARNKGIEFEWIDGLQPHSLIHTDPLKLQQILLNIIGNAIKFTKHGMVQVKMHITGDYLVFEIVDTGIGMNPKEISELFTPFSQADPSITRIYGGTGLGLALSRKLANALGGDVKILTSQPGKGSIFQITIHIGESMIDTTASNNEVSKNPKIAAAGSVNPLQNANILLAEDNEDLCMLFKHRLNAAGAKVTIVNNGIEAVHAVEDKKNFDLILMDIQMPVLDGYSAASMIRKQGIKTPIIACTARLMKEEIAKGKQAGITDYLEKPAHPDDLLSTCRKYL